MYPLLLYSMKRFDQAVAEHQQAIALDPLSLILNTDVGGRIILRASNTTGRLSSTRKPWNWTQTSAGPNFGLANAYDRKGMYKEAIAELQKAFITDGDPRTAALIGKAYSRSSYKGAIQAWLDDLIGKSTHQYVSRFDVATMYARLGQKEYALEWLEKGYQARDANMVDVGTEPTFDFLHSDPRYTDLLRRVGLPQ